MPIGKPMGKEDKSQTIFYEVKKFVPSSSIVF